MSRSKHRFLIEAEFDSSEEYDEFTTAIMRHGGEILDETQIDL